MHRRGKQLLYGLGYLLFLVLVIVLIYFIWFRPSATCFDGKLNQTEEEIDCGGVCGSCDVRHVRPIEISSVETVTVRDITIAVVEIRNPNSAFGVEGINYSLLVSDQLGDSIRIDDATFVYPGEIRYRVLIDVPVEESQGAELDMIPYSFSTSSLSWVRSADLIRPKTQFRDIRSELDVERKLLVVMGILKNDNDFAASGAVINALIRDKFSKLIGASKTLVKDLRPNEERFFQVIVPIQAGVAEGDISNPRLTVEIER